MDTPANAASGKKISGNLAKLRVLDYILITLVLIAIAVSAYQSLYVIPSLKSAILSVNHGSTTLPATVPSMVGNSTSNFGSRLTNIDMPLNSSELSVINNAPDSNFVTAGNMFLNGTIADYIFKGPVNKSYIIKPFISNGKASVIYIGATSCIYCGENRWAMALALSRFGNFSMLYKGYSALQDGDLPTLYWGDVNYTMAKGVEFGNGGYHSNYVNFIAGEYESPIKAGFQMAPLSYFVESASNSTYSAAMAYANSTKLFQGTPFTLWGNVVMPGADAVVFGDSMPTNQTLQLTYMTHEQVLQKLSSFNSQFAYAEYAAADVYTSFLCASLNNTPSVCSQPVIKSIEVQEGLA